MVRLVVSGPYHAGAFSFHLPSEMQLNLCPFAENTRNNYLLEGQALGQFPWRCYTGRWHVPCFWYCLPRRIKAFLESFPWLFWTVRYIWNFFRLCTSKDNQRFVQMYSFPREKKQKEADIPSISVLFFVRLWRSFGDSNMYIFSESLSFVLSKTISRKILLLFVSELTEFTHSTPVFVDRIFAPPSTTTNRIVGKRYRCEGQFLCFLFSQFAAFPQQ